MRRFSPSAHLALTRAWAPCAVPWKPVAALALGATVAVVVASAVLALGAERNPPAPSIVQLRPAPATGGAPPTSAGVGGAEVLVPPAVPLAPTPVPPPPDPAPAPAPSPAPSATAAPASPPPPVHLDDDGPDDDDDDGGDDD